MSQSPRISSKILLNETKAQLRMAITKLIWVIGIRTSDNVEAFRISFSIQLVKLPHRIIYVEGIMKN